MAQTSWLPRKGGVVVLFGGTFQSWVNKLRNPEHWQPGCLAVDEGTKGKTTVAANARDGTLLWLLNDLISD